MFEFEIGLGCFLFGLIFAWILLPKIIIPKAKTYFSSKKESHYHGRPKGAKNKPKVKEVETE